MEIAGRVMLRSIANFTQRCETLIRDEQKKILPDNMIIDVLCDAVRLCREMEDFHKSVIRLTLESIEKATAQPSRSEALPYPERTSPEQQTDPTER
jgi:hypothetical protein